MAKKNLYDVLGVMKTATEAEIKTAYRALAKKYHPDTNGGSKKATEMFKEVAAAYEILGDAKQRATYDNGKKGSGPLTIVSKTGRYMVDEIAFSGDVADIYRAVHGNSGDVFALKIARSHTENDLLENEAKVLRAIYPADTSSHRYHFYLPKLIDSFKVNDGRTSRQANILEWLADYHSLEKVRAAHPRLQMEHGVWMFNRILEILGYIHTHKDYVHGAIIPPHVLVYAGTKEKDIFNHGARLVGWSYCIPSGQQIRAISPEYEAFYPPEVLMKKPATAATDIYMAAKSIIYTLGGDISNPKNVDKYPSHLPNYFINFLRGCTLNSQVARPQDAWELHKELKEHMRKHFGPKKYVPFHMPLPA